MTRVIKVLFYCCHGITSSQRNFLPYGHKCSGHLCSTQLISFGRSCHESASCALSRQIFCPRFSCCWKHEAFPRQSESKRDWKGIKETSSACTLPQETVTGCDSPNPAQHLSMPTFPLSIHWCFSYYSCHGRTVLRHGLLYMGREDGFMIEGRSVSFSLQGNEALRNRKASSSKSV